MISLFDLQGMVPALIGSTREKQRGSAVNLRTDPKGPSVTEPGPQSGQYLTHFRAAAVLTLSGFPGMKWPDTF